MTMAKTRPPTPAMSQRAWNELLRAAEKVLDGLNARIDAAPSDAKPVFNGIVDLHDAINRVRRINGEID